DSTTTTPFASESSPSGPESPAARIWHGHQGTHAVTAGVVGGIGVCRPAQEFRHLAADSRRRTSAHHANRPRRQRGSFVLQSGRETLPIDTRLFGSLPARLAHSQTERDSAGSCRTVA